MDESEAVEPGGLSTLAQADALSHIEKTQQAFSKATSRAVRSAIGQFLTPAPIARFMASLFEKDVATARILDPGAGTGTLFAALTEHLLSRPHRPESIDVVAYETDPNIIPHLKNTMELCRELCGRAGVAFQGAVRREDFISAAVAQVRDNLFSPAGDGCTHAILNPPYKKINGATPTRRMLSSAGMETSNLYSAFVWLAAHFIRPGGEIVAITPRSFCNGPYFRRFRKALLGLIDLRHIHTFGSRKEAFADDCVLQENVIFHGIRNEPQKPTVRISVSRGPVFGKTPARDTPFRDVVVPDDPDAFIHLIEEDEGKQVMEHMSRFTTTLADLGLEVSTGRVVDFRARGFLRQDPEAGTAPLVYPCHFENGFVRWPIPGAKKPNAIVCSKQTQELFVPAGYYVLAKRFTAKEEPRRIVGAVYDPTRIDAPLVGFENHLNYFHSQGRGLSPDLARGLVVFLNSSLLDRYFRLFSGHTQVNAADLRKMRYPSREQMIQLSREMKTSLPNQERIDAAMERACTKHE
ncbi:MAG: Eco57I restriction-modification methylase domain-containing protein [Phycisphaerae bacterium]|nr:Eco57I restriction-modification methylase domain-containing protein [Phycisphaerae bacterium]